MKSNYVFIRPFALLSLSVSILFSLSFGQTPVIPLVPDKIDLTPAPTDSSTPLQTSQVPSSDSTQKIEKQDTIKNQELQPASNDFNNKEKQTSKLSLKQSWSYTLKKPVTGITICDIDNDKINETLIIAVNQLLVFQYKNKTFTQIAEYKASRGTQFLAIDAADLNQNGKPEIFVTACNASYNSLVSFTGEFENNKFNILRKRIPLFLRVVQNADSTILLGQDFSDAGVNFGKVYRLKAIDYSEKERIPFPKEHSILSVSSHVNKQDKTNYFLCYNSKGNVELINFTSFQSQYASSEKYGGNPEYLLLPSDEANTENRSYLQIRSLSADLNDDNENEIIVIKNHEFTNNILQNIKYYTKYHIELMKVSDGSLSPIWSSVKKDGYVSDCTFGDYNNDGKKELVIINVAKSDDLAFRKPLSEIVAFKTK